MSEAEVQSVLSAAPKENVIKRKGKLLGVSVLSVDRISHCI